MKLWQEVRREGKILDRVDVEDQSGGTLRILGRVRNKLLLLQDD